MLATSDLLDAAIRVVTRDGMGALTLDAVAREAGVSKGGLTHHYATKDALVTAMLEHFGQRLLRELDRFAADDPDLAGRRVRAMMKVAYPELRDDVAAPRSRRKKSTSANHTASSEAQQLFYAAIAAAVVNPKLLEPLRQHVAGLRDRMMQNPSDGLWQIITWLALDGLMIWQMLGLMTPDEPLHSDILQFLFKLSSNPPVTEDSEEVQHVGT